MNKKLYISILLLTMPALAFSMEASQETSFLENELASAKAIDAFVKSEILNYKAANHHDKYLLEATGKELFDQRLLSLKMVGDAQRALEASKIS